jgi:hypothetical protein
VVVLGLVAVPPLTGIGTENHEQPLPFNRWEHDGHDGDTTGTTESLGAVRRVRRGTVVTIVHPSVEEQKLLAVLRVSA